MEKKNRKKQGVLATHGLSGIDFLKDFIIFVFWVAGTFAYVLFIELILSFILLKLIHFTIKGMIIFAAVCAVLSGIYRIVWTVMKYRRIFGG